MHGLIALILTVLAVVIFLPFFVFPPKDDPSVTDWFIVIFTVVASGVAAIQAMISAQQSRPDERCAEDQRQECQRC